jgi:8-oxo-dGTP pyrophosphatase MutT (NUDIX family)
MRNAAQNGPGDPRIVAAVIRDAEGRVLLVEQRGPEDPASTWLIPGGQIEPGESPVEAVIREVLEETGLVVAGEPVLLFTAAYVWPNVGEWVAATYACEVLGTVLPADPDGYVLAAEWFDPAEAMRRVAAVRWYDPEPLRRWLFREAAPGARYGPSLRSSVSP